MSTAKLTNKQRAFVVAYLSNGFNGTQAVITAGYSENGAAVTAHDLLRNTNIKAEIEAYFDEYSMSAKEVLAISLAHGGNRIRLSRISRRTHISALPITRILAKITY